MKVLPSFSLMIIAGCAALQPDPQIITRVDTVTVIKEVAPPIPPGDTLTICLSNGMPAPIVVSAAGDTLINGIPLKSVQPILSFAGDYMEERVDTIRFERRLYRRAGLAQRKMCDELKEVGRYAGIPVFADITAPQTLPTIFLPVRPSLFQPYTTPTPRRR